MSYFRPNVEAMSGYTPGFQPKEPGFVKLNTNECTHAPSERVIEAVRQATARLNKYPEPMADTFRRRAAQVLGTVPERILCGNGSDDLLTIAVRSFCGEGDVLAYPHPTYSLYPVLARIQGARAVEVPFPDDFSLPDGLAEAGARLTIVASPNSPSGTVVPPEQLEALARRLDGVLLIDEAYVDFADRNCLDLVDRCENVIVARTLSKSYALAGLRFGYAVAQEHLIEGLAKVKDSYNVSQAAIAGATAAIADQDWVQANVEAIRAGRARLTEGLTALGFRVWPSQANFVFTRVPSGRFAEQVYRRLFERKILVRYWNAPRLSDCLRITVGSADEVEAVLAALSEIMQP